MSIMAVALVNRQGLHIQSYVDADRARSMEDYATFVDGVRFDSPTQQRYCVFYHSTRKVLFCRQFRDW